MRSLVWTAALTLALVPAIASVDRPQSTAAPAERTPIFICGQDQQLPNPILLHWTTLVLAGDARLYSPCGPSSEADREVRERSVIDRGFRSQLEDQRWRAAQAIARIRGFSTYAVIAVTSASGQRGGIGAAIGDNLGGFVPAPVTSLACDAEVRLDARQRRWLPGQILRMLMDRSVMVQKEGAYALAVRLGDPDLDPDVRKYAIAEARKCYERPLDPEVKGLILEAFGVARYSTDAECIEAEDFLVRESTGAPAEILGAVRGLEALFRQNLQHLVAESTRARLRELVAAGRQVVDAPALDPSSRIPRVALIALQTARDSDLPTVSSAATSADWQLRRLAAARLNLAEPSQETIGALLDRDESFQVRYEMIGALSRRAGQTGICAPLIAHLKDPAPVVVLRTMDLLVSTCTDLDPAVELLVNWLDELRQAADLTDWRRSSRALSALVRLNPEKARAHLALAVKHPVWQVRAAAAASCAALADQAAVALLVRDSESNVRTAALQALALMQNAELVPASIDALKTGADYQLLRTAALLLKNAAEDVKDDATEALLGALRRLTDEETDTSRDTRVAILDRLAEHMRPERSADLLPFTLDYDDQVAVAARKAFVAIVGAPPAESKRRRRYPYQPTQEAVGSLPAEATIRIDGGVIVLKFLPDVAPVTTARFAGLVRAGFYNNTTFYRAVPNFMVQGGSPGGNEYSATSRFMREEVGPQAWHVRGAVGVSTRGGDTGDGQIFVDLVDLPQFDRDYTVFAYVTQGMEFIDRMLDGAKILSISVK